MIDTDALRKKVLYLAIQGKLTEQLPSDGTAEELYKQIQAEKQKLIKEGKIKKEKPLPEISEKEIPFDIPESWKWCRIGDIFSLTMGQSPDGRSVSKNGDGIEFHQGKIFFGENYIQKSDQTTSEPSKIAEANSVLLCVRAPVGIVNITDRDLCIGRGLCSIMPLSDMTSKFTLYFIRCLENDFIKKATGTTFVAITGEVVKNQLIPLPPLAEQRRIVAKIDEIFAQIDIIDDLQSKYIKDSAVLKTKLLDAAIRGRLVEQRAEEGTAEELYRQIQSEKAKLIKEGKITKEKPLPEISEKEIPFDIPESWKWVRLGDICPGIKTGSLDANQKDDNGKYPFFTCGEEVYSTKDYAFDCDAILLGGNNASGDYKMHRYNGKFNAYQRVYVISGYHLCLDYVFWVIKYWLPHLKTNSQGVTTRFIRIGQVTNMLIPLPPLAEQVRIAAKIEELLPLCERLAECREKA